MKLLIALGTAAVLTAACTASGSGPGSGTSGSNTGSTVHLASGSNAGTSVAGADDVNRVNPLVGKAGSKAPLPAQSHVAAAAPATAPVVVQDRCNGGIGNPPAAGNRGAPTTPGKVPQLPACMPE